MSDELKLAPCPFCGSEAVTDFIDDESYLIECDRCASQTRCCDSKAEAIAAWNRRATPSPSTAPTEQNQAKSLPARRFVSVKGFLDADYVEFAEGCAKGGGVLDGVHHQKHYTRCQAESYVSVGAWREVEVPLSVEQSSTAGAAKGGNTSTSIVESSTAPIAEDEIHFDQIENAFPETGMHTRREDGALVVSAQWCHDFARNIAALASKPAAREAARQSIENDGEFQDLVGDVYRAGSYNESIEKPLRALIAHIDTWGGAAPTTGNTEPEE